MIQLYLPTSFLQLPLQTQHSIPIDCLQFQKSSQDFYGPLGLCTCCVVPCIWNSLPLPHLIPTHLCSSEFKSSLGLHQVPEASPPCIWAEPPLSLYFPVIMLLTPCGYCLASWLNLCPDWDFCEARDTVLLHTSCPEPGVVPDAQQGLRSFFSQ